MVQTVFLYRSMFIRIPPPFACSCPTTCCRTWAWCCCSLRKILKWEKTERNKEIIITTNPTLLAKSWGNSQCIKPFPLETSKKQTTRQRTRLKVTVCLYLNPSNSARSLSTLMAEAVVRESPQKVKSKILKRQVNNTPVSACDCHQKGSKKRLNNNANKKISHSQAAEQKFCWRMNRRHFAKRNEDQSVAECCGESKKNVERKNEYKEWCLINHPVKLT